MLLLVFCALGTVAFFYNFVALAFIQATRVSRVLARGYLESTLHNPLVYGFTPTIDWTPRTARATQDSSEFREMLVPQIEPRPEPYTGPYGLLN